MMRNTFIFSILSLIVVSIFSCSKEIPREAKPFLINEWKVQSISFPRTINTIPDTIILNQPASARLEFTEFGNWAENLAPIPDVLPNPLPAPVGNNIVLPTALEKDLKTMSGYYKISKDDVTVLRFLPTGGSDTSKISGKTDSSFLLTRIITKVVDPTTSRRDTFLIRCKK
jgi:hypothetical protein